MKIIGEGGMASSGIVKAFCTSASILALALGVSTSALAQSRPSGLMPMQTNSGANVVQKRTELRNYELDLYRSLETQQGVANAYRDALHIARCLRERDGAAANTLIGGPHTEDPRFNLLVRTLKVRRNMCLAGTDGRIPMMISASLAETDLHARGIDWEPRAMTVNVDEAEAFYMPDDGKVTLDSIGRCAAVYSPGLAYAVLKTEVASSAERDALDTLYKSTPECGLAELPSEIPVYRQRAAVANGLFSWVSRAE